MTARGILVRLGLGAAVALATTALVGNYVAPQSASASPPALQACTANHVKVTTKMLNAARGQVREVFKLKNTGASTCGMDGYPSLTFFTESSLDAHVKIVHHSSAFASVVPKLLAIGPNQIVSFGLSYHNPAPATVASPEGCLVESVLIQLPLAPTATGDFAYHEKFDACRAGNVVAVTPVEGRTLPQRRAY